MVDKPAYINYAMVNRVIDGDTWDCTTYLPFGIKCDQRFRLHGWDTPESWRPKTGLEAEHGRKAAEFVRDLVEGKVVMLKTHKLAVYGRYEAELWLIDKDWNPTQNLGDLLKENDLLKRESY